MVTTEPTAALMAAVVAYFHALPLITKYPTTIQQMTVTMAETTAAAAVSVLKPLLVPPPRLYHFFVVSTPRLSGKAPAASFLATALRTPEMVNPMMAGAYLSPPRKYPATNQKANDTAMFIPTEVQATSSWNGILIKNTEEKNYACSCSSATWVAKRLALRSTSTS